MRNKTKGFTLLELMLVVIIITLLALIAIPAFTEQVTKARRTDGKVALLDLTARMERYYAENHTYATATLGANVSTDVLSSATSPEGYYQLSIVNKTATSFLIQAAPVPGSAQVTHDTKCANLRINQLGQKTITGTGSAAECW